jgi:hypothetical protein
MSETAIHPSPTTLAALERAIDRLWLIDISSGIINDALRAEGLVVMSITDVQRLGVMADVCTFADTGVSCPGCACGKATP